MTEYKGSEELLARRADFMQEHYDQYLLSGGREGHLVELSAVGARGYLPCLMIKTVGRKSGRTLITPLIYGVYAGEWVIIGSKGGAPAHPAWYLNILEMPQIEMQVATEAYRAKWRVAEGAERKRVWDYMADLFPSYNDYQKAAGREIPVVMMWPQERVPVFEKP
jgi:deazaflavin-dependent oxidoreductase (nitroreductase family)